MKIIQLEAKLREFAQTRSISLACEICDGLIEDFNRPKKVYDEPSTEISDETAQ